MQEVKLYLRDENLGPVDGDAGQEAHQRWEATVVGSHFDAAGATPEEALANLAVQVKAELDPEPEKTDEPAPAASLSGSGW